jgi:hypothetical protein
MELFKKFGFWAAISFCLMLALFFLWILGIVEDTSIFVLSLFILNCLSLLLSIIGLVRKEGSKALSIIFLVLPILIILVVLIARLPSPPTPSSSCVGIGGQCTEATDCVGFEDQYGGTWAHDYAHDGKPGGCVVGEICCQQIEVVPT